MEKIAVLLLLLVTLVCATSSLPTLPMDSSELNIDPVAHDPKHNIRRRFISPMFNMGTADTQDIVKMRTKRSYDECEKLQLCKLHARSQRNFFAAYELYFVNKENARLWDHRARSAAECEQRFGDCYDK